MTDQLDKHVSWKNHINKMLPKLSSACSVVGSMYSYSKVSTLKMIYFAHFHATMEYVFIFWGNLIDSKKVFLQQQNIIRILNGSSSRTSCKLLFHRLELLTLTLQYILSLIMSQNLEIYTFNSTVHAFKTSNKLQLHKPQTTLTT
jgi:hypothetical protein